MADRFPSLDDFDAGTNQRGWNELQSLTSRKVKQKHKGNHHWTPSNLKSRPTFSPVSAQH